MSNETPSNRPQIEAAVKAFVRALYFESPEAVQRLLIDNQALLLTDAAVDFLDEQSVLAEYSGIPGDFDFAMLQLQLTPYEHTPVPNLAALLRTPLELLPRPACKASRSPGASLRGGTIWIAHSPVRQRSSRR